MTEPHTEHCPCWECWKAKTGVPTNNPTPSDDGQVYQLQHHHEVIGGEKRDWWEIQAYRPGRQSQVCHCADEEDAQMIFAALKRHVAPPAPSDEALAEEIRATVIPVIGACLLMRSDDPKLIEPRIGVATEVARAILPIIKRHATKQLDLSVELAALKADAERLAGALKNIRALATKRQAVGGSDGALADIEGFARAALAAY